MTAATHTDPDPSAAVAAFLALAVASAAPTDHHNRVADEQLGDAPTGDWAASRRGLRPEPRILIDLAPTVALADARAMLHAALLDYVALDKPDHALLVRVQPGVGKTTAAVHLAELLAQGGKRVLWLANRHNMYPELLNEAKHHELWYEWQPRRGPDAAGCGATCRYPTEITTWMQHGHKAWQFCQTACGNDYMNNECVWYAQAKVTAPIIVGQHQHLVAGHPFLKDADVIIGDEFPLDVFKHEWRIPAHGIIPDLLIPEDALTTLLWQLHGLVQSGGSFSGPTLITMLGGPRVVFDALQGGTLPDQGVPQFQRPADVERASYAYVPTLIDLLSTEAASALKTDTERYPHRVLVEGGNLVLLLKRAVADDVPAHRIWLDATADPYLYERITGWQMQTFAPLVARQGITRQMWDATNNKSSLLDKDRQPTPRVPKLQAQVAEIVKKYSYQRPVVITYQAALGLFPDYEHSHFYGTRGTNAHTGADAIIIVGTPQAPAPALLRDAAMLFFDRMTPFDATWREEHIAYAGHPFSYPANGFWDDPDLEALHAQTRNAELVQAAMRGRSTIAPCDIWLLTSHPIRELAPDELLTVKQLFDAPADTDAYQWSKALDVAETIVAERGLVTPQDLVDTLGIHIHTAHKYLDRLLEQEGWEATRAVTKKRGPKPKAATKS